MSNNNLKNMRYADYTPGSAAPKIQPKEDRQEKRAHVKEARVELRSQVLRREKAAKEFTKGQILTFAVCLALILGAASLYVVQLSDIRETRAAAEMMEKEYKQLVRENTLAKNQRLQNVDYDAVYTYATEVLHMRAPEKQQIVYYRNDPYEYVSKKADIPND